MAKVYAVVTIRERTHMDGDVEGDGRFIVVLDHDPKTKKSFKTYDNAVLHAILVLAGYATE